MDEIIVPGLSHEQVHALHRDLHPGRVAKRTHAGRNLNYLEAWDVKASLIRVFGYGNFTAETIKTEVLNVHPYQNDSGKDMLKISVLVTVRLVIHATGATYTETAVASQSGPDYGDVADFAVKTAASDALKRAATYLGTQFGLSLYRGGQTRDVVRAIVEPDQAKALNAPQDVADAEAETTALADDEGGAS